MLWNPSKVVVQSVETYPQVIHCQVICKVTINSFFVSFVYGFNSIISRRPFWDYLGTVGQSLSQLWLLLGDFNNVLRIEEKINGTDITPYEIRDMMECCLSLGLNDLQSVGCLYTWTDNSVWYKLDRVMVNNHWMFAGYYGQANFLPSGCLSDHSPFIVSMNQLDRGKLASFKFFNMWTSHTEFQATVSKVWRQEMIGTKQFALCTKLKILKEQLKILNQKHFSHISARAERAHMELKKVHMQLHNHSTNILLQ